MTHAPFFVPCAAAIPSSNDTALWEAVCQQNEQHRYVSIILDGIGKRKLVRRTLFMSGYTDDAIGKHGVLEPGLAFIYKPFTAEGLFLKLREVLDGPADKAKA